MSNAVVGHMFEQSQIRCSCYFQGPVYSDL